LYDVRENLDMRTRETIVSLSSYQRSARQPHQRAD